MGSLTEHSYSTAAFFLSELSKDLSMSCTAREILVSSSGILIAPISGFVTCVSYPPPIALSLSMAVMSSPAVQPRCMPWRPSPSSASRSCSSSNRSSLTLRALLLAAVGASTLPFQDAPIGCTDIRSLTGYLSTLRPGFMYMSGSMGPWPRCQSSGIS